MPAVCLTVWDLFCLLWLHACVTDVTIVEDVFAGTAMLAYAHVCAAISRGLSGLKTPESDLIIECVLRAWQRSVFDASSDSFGSLIDCRKTREEHGGSDEPAERDGGDGAVRH